MAGGTCIELMVSRDLTSFSDSSLSKAKLSLSCKYCLYFGFQICCLTLARLKCTLFSCKMHPSTPDFSVWVCYLLNLSMPLILVTRKLSSDGFQGSFLDMGGKLSSRKLVTDSQGTMLKPESLGNISMFACTFETSCCAGFNSAQEHCTELVLSLLLYQNLVSYQIKCSSEIREYSNLLQQYC